jgi:catechol 2,3-dioxygenase-like lactoylglutathione lyase family enzyme
LDVTSIQGQAYYHVGIVVHDIVEAAERWGSRLGVSLSEHFLTGDFTETGMTFRTPTDGRAKVMLFPAPGGTTIELLQPIGGPPEWSRFLEKRGDGLHHLAWTVDDFPTVVGAYREQGAQIVQAGRFIDPRTGQPGQYVYLQQHPDDLVFEIIGSGEAS